MNHRVLMSGATYFSDQFAINAYMDASIAVDVQQAQREHDLIRQSYIDAGIKVEQVTPPTDCQDGVYTANWAVTKGRKAVLSNLPNKRKAEEPAAEAALKARGFSVVRPPFPFSGQGDALPCGDLLFMGTGYRTDPRAHQFVASQLGYQIVGLQTIPSIDEQGKPIINSVTGWPDSFFYDLDLALSVLTPTLIAWCPEAFVPESQAKIQALPIEKIEVDIDEATKGFACNLVSTGETVIMSAQAPRLQAAIHAKGLKTITPAITELAKGGGYIRCVSLTLDNN